MKINRKKWIRPQLIVLGRGTPEENVLFGCKTAKLRSKGSTKRDGCVKKPGGSCNGGQCKVVSTS